MGHEEAHTTQTCIQREGKEAQQTRCGQKNANARIGSHELQKQKPRQRRWVRRCTVLRQREQRAETLVVLTTERAEKKQRRRRHRPCLPLLSSSSLCLFMSIGGSRPALGAVLSIRAVRVRNRRCDSRLRRRPLHRERELFMIAAESHFYCAVRRQLLRDDHAAELCCNVLLNPAP